MLYEMSCYLCWFTCYNVVLDVMLFRLLTYALVYHMQFVIWEWSNEISMFASPVFKELLD